MPKKLTSLLALYIFMYFTCRMDCKNDEHLLQCLQNVTTDELKEVFNIKQLLSIWCG